MTTRREQFYAIVDAVNSAIDDSDYVLARKELAKAGAFQMTIPTEVGSGSGRLGQQVNQYIRQTSELLDTLEGDKKKKNSRRINKTRLGRF